MVPRFAVLLVAGALAGCGGGDESPTTLSPASTPEPAATPAVSPTQDRDTGPADAPRTAKVAMEGFEFATARVEIARGGRVTWINRDRANHTVTFEDEGQPGIDNLRPERREAVTFNERGTFAYVCDFHPTMVGTVEVR